MLRISVSPNWISPGGQITVLVKGCDVEPGLKNVQIGFNFVALSRDRGSFSAGINAEVGECFKVTITVPGGVAFGPHILSDLRLLPLPDAAGHVDFSAPRHDLLQGLREIADLAVFVGDSSPSNSAAEQVRELHALRLTRIRSRIEVYEATQSATMRVAYLYSGLLVHGPQHCEGYSILPYGEGLAPTSIFSALNRFSEEVFHVTFSLSPQQLAEYTDQQPLAGILFHNVGAPNAETAMQGVRHRADEISLALAFERGQAPQPFGCIVENGNNLNMWLLHRPYRGNLLSPFSQTDQGAEVERLTAAMLRSPFSKLLLELYVQAISDDDPMFMFFRFWAIVELLAKRAIPESHHHIFDAHGEHICGPNSQLITTSKAEAKVYKYLFDQGTGGSYSILQTPEGPFTVIVEGVSIAPPLEGPGLRVTYWEYIQAIYAIRNAVAHEGRFTPDEAADFSSPAGLAAKLMNLNRDSILRYVRDTARLAVMRELHRLSRPDGPSSTEGRRT